MNLSVRHLLVAVLFLAASTTITAQEVPVSLSEKWSVLKKHHLQRAEICIALANTLGKTSEADKETVNKMLESGRNLKQYIKASTQIDSLTIQTTLQKSIIVMLDLSRSLAMLMQDSTLLTPSQAVNLQTSLMSIENKLLLSKRNYNELCHQFQRIDLLFDKPRYLGSAFKGN